MAQEIEAKILKIDLEKLKKKFADIGAIKEAEVFFRSTSFDFTGLPLDKDMSWVRLRDDGKKITLAYKKRLGVTGIQGQNDSGMEEVEVEVSSYEDTVLLLQKIGMVIKFSQEKKRITWKKDGVTFDIDTWPRLDTYLEIEAESWEKIDDMIVKLGFDLKDKIICSATQIYEMNGINDKDYSVMTFDTWVKRDEAK
jgi:adenylate cyclase class 2